MRRQIQGLTWALVSIAALGCTRDRPQAGPPVTSTSAPSASETAELQMEKRSEAFEIRLKAPSSLAVNATGELTLVLVAKKGFHVNAEYPLSFRPQNSSSGIQFEKARFELRENAETEPCIEAKENACTLSARVPFKTSAKGEQQVAGLVAFSVCNPDRCLIEKAQLGSALTVR